MTSESEPEGFTWQSLYQYIERRIAGVLKTLQFLKEDPRVKNDGEIHTASFERELWMLRACLELVTEMQSRESLQNISPMLSLDLIRLRCRHHYSDQVDRLEFAWISPIAERRYGLRRMGIKESQEPGKLDLIDASLVRVVEEVEKLVKEICIGEHE